jgi:hypothetical protein
MLTLTTKRLDPSVLPLWNAVFCLDCEVISESQGDECPCCKNRSLVSLARMLGGSLSVRRKRQLREGEGALFDITITVELQHMDAKDVTTTLDRLTNVIAQQLARDQAALHIKVQPTGERRDQQRSLSFPERDAA